VSPHHHEPSWVTVALFRAAHRLGGIMVANFFDVLCPAWRITLFGVSSDEAPKMTGRLAGAVTRLQEALYDGSELARI
jgi:hypothetical protein